MSHFILLDTSLSISLSNTIIELQQTKRWLDVDTFNDS